jgi:hypothetical protein
MASPEYSIRLDPWAAEFEPSIQALDEPEAPSVDIRVESSAWAAIRAAAAEAPRLLAFVDGVRRVEHRLLVADGERTVFGLLGSYGVGAVLVDGWARVAHEAVGRVLVTAGGHLLPPFLAPVGDGRLVLEFEPRCEPENRPDAPLAGLQKAMRQGEAALAERLSAECDVVFQDGPLSFVTERAPGSVVGLIKRQMRSYLDASAQPLLPRLAVGERTPVFLIEGPSPRWSWYERLALGRAIHSPLTGVVRLEASGSRPLSDVVRLADLAARELPRYASDAAHDPRAPQNLFPIGGLEARLKHLLGDPAVVRRAIEARVHSEVTA